MDATTILSDPAARVPEADPAATGPFAAFRAACSRFVNGAEHARRRAFLVARLEALDLDDLGTLAARAAERSPEHLPVATLARALGFTEPDRLPPLVATIAAAYPTGAGDAAVDAATTAALACAPHPEPALHLQLLVQASAATAALACGVRPPVPVTRRLLHGDELVVALGDVPFGAGPRACPARAIAELLAAACTP